MKKILPVILLAILCALPEIGSAQKVKFGHCDYNAIKQAIPGYDTIQNAVKTFNEELEKELNAMAEELQIKYNDYQQKAGTLSAAATRVKEQEIKNLQERIQKYKEDARLQIHTMLLERDKPFDTMTKEAIGKVAKSGGFTYIFDSSIPLYSADSTDITELVKQKLGIK